MPTALRYTVEMVRRRHLEAIRGSGSQGRSRRHRSVGPPETLDRRRVTHVVTGSKGARSAVASCIAGAMIVALSGPAVAGRLIIYRGETSEGERVAARVIQRDNGRRLLAKIGFERVVVTCEVGPGDEFGVLWAFGTPRPRLAEDGSFSIDERAAQVTGRFWWGRGEGTIEVSYDQDGGVCTTGELTWDVVRTRSQPFVARKG